MSFEGCCQLSFNVLLCQSVEEALRLDGDNEIARGELRDDQRLTNLPIL